MSSSFHFKLSDYKLLWSPSSHRFTTGAKIIWRPGGGRWRHRRTLLVQAMAAKSSAETSPPPAQTSGRLVDTYKKWWCFGGFYKYIKDMLTSIYIRFGRQTLRCWEFESCSRTIWVSSGKKETSAFGESTVSSSDMISSVFWDQREMNKRMHVLWLQKDLHRSMNPESGKPGRALK